MFYQPDCIFVDIIYYGTNRSVGLVINLAWTVTLIYKIQPKLHSWIYKGKNAAKIPSSCFSNQLWVKLEKSVFLLTKSDIAFLGTDYFPLSNNGILGFLYISEDL